MDIRRLQNLFKRQEVNVIPRLQPSGEGSPGVDSRCFKDSEQPRDVHRGQQFMKMITHLTHMDKLGFSIPAMTGVIGVANILGQLQGILGIVLTLISIPTALLMLGIQWKRFKNYDKEHDVNPR